MKITQMDPQAEQMPAKTAIHETAIHASPPLRIADPKLDPQNNPILKAEMRKDVMDAPKVRAEVKERMDRAIQKANASIQGMQQFHSIQFRYHEESGYSYAVIHDMKSGRAIGQIPATEFLDIAARMKEASGIFVNTKG
ncbi:MAG: flagellar protein FlaG [Deltaproteobacteria bacterium]|nr:flagellar protein FlaG [Deltaproteobacteria bacterium]